MNNKLKHNVMTKHARSIGGFSLIELMVAMTLGLFLVAGVGTVYMSSKRTYSLQNQTNELDENARAAIRALRHHIAHAGYASISGMVIDNYIIPPATTIAATNCADGDPNIENTSAIDASTDGTANNGGDTIGLIFLADDTLATDCTGGTVRTQCLPPDSPDRDARLVYNSFSVGNSSADNIMGTAVPALRCGGSLNTVRQPWAQGIENIQFLYGIDSNADGAVDNYWNATTVTSNSVWDNVISVQVGLLIRSIDPVYSATQSESFQVLDQLITRNDRYRRNVYTTTVRLKNVARRI